MHSKLAVTVLSVFALIATGCANGEGNACPVTTRPAVPVLLSVTQDPATLTVTATIRDESDNEQWFALERALRTRRNLPVVVGTDIPAFDSDALPIGADIGNTVSIIDLGIVKNEKPEPGLVYAYAVRAWNCHGTSAASNDIQITSMFPVEQDG